MPPPVRQWGIQEAVVSVFDLDHLSRPLVDTRDFTLVALPDAPRSQWSAWKVPDGCTRIEQVLLRHNSTPAGQGSLRLVKFHGCPQQVMRSSQRSWDTGGIFDVDVLTTDVTAAYRRLQTFGWTALGEPVDYSEAVMHVRQVVAQGPNGFMLAMIQSHRPPLIDLPPYKVLSPIFNSTQMVSDLDRALDFYNRVLGWSTRLRFDITDQAEPGADVLGLPMPSAVSAVRRLAMTSAPWDMPAGVELIENRSMAGRDFSTTCVAPNVGILCLRMPVPDVCAYAREIVGRGGTLFSKLQATEVAPYGNLTAFSIQSPEGALLEFYGQGQ